MTLVKVFVNILLTFIVLSAFLSSCWLGVETGNYWAVVFILFVIVLYFSLTWSFQRVPINTLIDLAIMGLGFVAIWLGISEFSAPIDFSRTLPHLVVNLIRHTAGPIGVSLFMWWIGGVFIFIAIARLRVRKFACPKPSIKRDA